MDPDLEALKAFYARVIDPPREVTRTEIHELYATGHISYERRQELIEKIQTLPLEE